MLYPIEPFHVWLTQRVGKWVVAPRLTPRLKAKGYVVAIPPAEYNRRHEAHEAAREALASSLEPMRME